jgi:hypothetical protein
MQTVKLDPIAYVLILGVLSIQIYTGFLRANDTARTASDLLQQNDAAYQSAVFGSSDNKGVMHQVFRQNEVDRELLKELVVRCGP